MSVEANKQVVRRLLDALSSGKLDVVLDSMSETATWLVPLASNTIPALKGPKSKAEFAAQAQQLGPVMPKGVRLVTKTMTAEGDRVAVEVEASGVTSRGDQYANLYHFLFEVKNGKVQAVKEYCDTLHIQETVGWAFDG